MFYKFKNIKKGIENFEIRKLEKNIKKRKQKDT